MHGFTQTAASWDAVVTALPVGLDPVALELPGHGARAEDREDFRVAAATLGSRGGRALYVGYSMGGRLTLELALSRPDLVPALVLLGASPGIADPQERAARRGADELLATELESDGVEPFLARWLAQPMFANVPADAAGLAARYEGSPTGLAAALRSLGTGSQPNRWDDLGALSMPVLLVAGDDDVKFRAIADEMAECIGENARATVMPGRGHAAFLEDPAGFARIIADFARDVTRD